MSVNRNFRLIFLLFFIVAIGAIVFIEAKVIIAVIVATAPIDYSITSLYWSFDASSAASDAA